MRIGLLVSGAGSIAGQMLDEALPVAVVVGDRACPGLSLAAKRGYPAELVDRRQFGGFGPAFDRDGFSDTLVGVLRRHRVDLVVMAGFGTVVGAVVHDVYPGRVTNTHPSLLPAHPGWHAVADALASGDTVTGCTVHLAELAVDQGPILAQQEVPVLAGDTVERLHERIKVVERVLYPATIHRMLRALAAGVEPGDLRSLHGTLARPLTAEQVARADDHLAAPLARAQPITGYRQEAT
ncbi:MAG: formyltransferase family protein [Actinomycetota bacterium]|nr:formyltransferase family protein [Actinomycetota bacterium]